MGCIGVRCAMRRGKKKRKASYQRYTLADTASQRTEENTHSPVIAARRARAGITIWRAEHRFDHRSEWAVTTGTTSKDEIPSDF